MVNVALIEELRKKKGLRAIDIAKHLNIVETAYYNKINGYRKFKFEEMVKISRIFNIPLDEFVKEEK